MRIVIALVFAIVVVSCTSTQSPSGATPVDEGKSLVNPINPTPESLASGKKLYDRLCADCHGTKGDGVSGQSGYKVSGQKEETPVAAPSKVEDPKAKAVDTATQTSGIVGSARNNHPALPVAKAVILDSNPSAVRPW